MLLVTGSMGFPDVQSIWVLPHARTRPQVVPFTRASVALAVPPKQKAAPA